MKPARGAKTPRIGYLERACIFYFRYDILYLYPRYEVIKTKYYE